MGNLTQGILQEAIADGIGDDTLTLRSEAEADRFDITSTDNDVYIGIRQHQSDVPSLEKNTEFMKVTAKAGATLTVLRGQGGSSRREFEQGAYIYETLLKESIEQLHNRIEAGLVGGNFRGVQVFSDLENTESAGETDISGEALRRYRAFFIPYFWSADTVVLFLSGQIVSLPNGSLTEAINWRIVFKDQFEDLPELAQNAVVDRDTDSANYIRMSSGTVIHYLVRGANNQLGYVNNSNIRVIKELRIRSIGS